MVYNDAQGILPTRKVARGEVEQVVAHNGNLLLAEGRYAKK